MSAVITTAMLKAAKACDYQLALFNTTFGNSAAVSRKTVAVAFAAGLNISWTGRTLLTGEFKRAYNTATAEAGAAFNAAMAEPRLAYYAAKNVADNAVATAEALKPYHAATADALKPYNATTTEAFADAYIAQCQTVKEPTT
jgi:hypothetical protein